MIEAYFDRASRSALITGVYQYDTGQRLRLSGLPSPEELAEMDEMLSGEVVTVSVHYSRAGDTQTVATLATYDEYTCVWTANIPDEYLTRHVAINVQVHTYYGSDGVQERGKTMFEGVFTPIRRAAPNNTVSDDQLEQWGRLEQEVQLSLAPLDTATTKASSSAAEANEAAARAGTAAESAKDAAQRAEDSLENLGEAENALSKITIRVTQLADSANATATRSGDTITLGIPRGKAGKTGRIGDDGPSDIGLSMTDGVLTITPK